MFWIYYYLVLIGLNIVAYLVCIFFYIKNRNTDYKDLKYRKIKNGSIIKSIDNFYSDKKRIETLIEGKSLLYRKAQLSNKLSGRGTRKEIYFLVGSAILCGVISLFVDNDDCKRFLACIGVKTGENDKILMILLSILFVIIVIKLFNVAFNNMNDVRSESYRYELSHIESILDERVDLLKTSGEKSS